MQALSRSEKLFVSIHAPAWGATAIWIVLDGEIGFQSTRPRGARHEAINNKNIQMGVSIHAPAWGATISIRLLDRFLCCFNPRARVGRDIKELCYGC